MNFFKTLGLLFFAISFTLHCTAQTTISKMKVLEQTCPIGIDEKTPSFSWQIESNQQGFHQAAYSIIVRNSDGKIVWNSGKIMSAKQHGIIYSGKTLESRTKYLWTVQVYDTKGAVYSNSSSFETAFLKSDEWSAKWISSTDTTGNVPYFAKSFHAKRKIKRARIYASALGIFNMKLNGINVTENRLEPGETEYSKHVLYSTYDVTDLITCNNENFWSAQVAGGIFNIFKLNGRFSKPEVTNHGDNSLIAELFIDYEDGTTDCIVTDNTWKTAPSPTTGSNWWGGEDYDARLYKPLPSLKWSPVKVVDSPMFTKAIAPSQNIGTLKARSYEPVRVVEQWKAQSITTLPNGKIIVDFGQNFAGQYSFQLKGARNQMITLKESSTLNEDGSCVEEFMYEWHGPNLTQDRYIFRGDVKGETWGPEFMYHGFRYLEIEGLNYEPLPSDFTALRMRCNMEQTGDIHMNNQLLDSIHIICRNGIQSQLYNTITDCPHREKLGWLDVANELFNSLNYNYDMTNFWKKIVMDCFDAQHPNGRVPSTAPSYMSVYDDDPNWGGSAILVPYRVYKATGDSSLIQQYYPQMKKLILYYLSNTSDGILQDRSTLSDWGQQTSGVTEPMVSAEFTITTTLYYMLNAMTEMAQLLNKDDDASLFTYQASNVKKAFNERYFNSTTYTYEHGHQANYAMPLYYGLVESKYETAVAKKLANKVIDDGYRIRTGEIGLKPMLMSLAKYGYNDIVYTMINLTDFPSYGYFVKQGATTSPEYWDMSLSQIHCMMNHIEEWFFSQIGGLITTNDHITIQPWIHNDMQQMVATHHNDYGTILSSYTQTKENISFRFEIPANTTATLILPGNFVSGTTNGVTKIQKNKETSILETGSGTYYFTTNINNK